MTTVLLFFAATLLLYSATAFNLDGSQNSYAQFRKWNSGLNGTLEFEFKTKERNGMLLYTDDGGKYDFFEIKLVEGALRLRYNLGGGAQILTVGRDLSDERWHKVQIVRHGERTSLVVDEASQTRTSRGLEFQFGDLATNSDVFVGGVLPTAKLTTLALPSVIFEPRFIGSVRNLVYADEESDQPRRQEMRAHGSKRLRGGSDVCETQDPCLHGGICISTDTGPVCECRNLDYEGALCEKDKTPPEATFRGSEFLSYDFNRTGAEPIVSSQDMISLHFKTSFPNGLLFYTGDGQDFLNLAVKEGGIVLTMSLGNGKLEMNIRPNRVRFDDNQWHKLTVRRKLQEISAITSFCRLSAVVDGTYSDHSHVAGTSAMLASSKVFVGGSHSLSLLPGSKVHNNFVGCLRKVEFIADTIKLNLIELGRTGSKLINVAGNIDWSCTEVEAADPVTFTTREAHLVLPDWDAGRTGSMSFKMRTNEAQGLLMISHGPNAPHPDFFAFEVVDGHFVLHIDLGSGPIKVHVSGLRVDDGAWHEIILRRNGRNGRILLDREAVDFVCPGPSDLLDLSGGLFVGGVGPPISQVKVPVYLWTGLLRLGFVGCMRDLVINGNAVDIAGYARQQDTAAIRPSCHVQPPQCSSNPCMNGGLCTEGWNRFMCDCSRTAFVGPTCGKDAATLMFNGSQYMAVHLGELVRSQVEDITLRFRTAHGSGLLLSTSADNMIPDKIQLALVSGRLRLDVRTGDLEKNIATGQNLGDNIWHSIKLSRRESHFHLQLDDDVPVKAEKDIGQGNVLGYQTYFLGGFPSSEETVNIQRVPGFIGAIQHFTFNNVPYLEMAKAQHQSSKSKPFKITAKFSKREHYLLHHIVTFKSKHTFVGMPALKAYSTTNLYFQFKTRESNGLILYNSGKDQDFIAVELVSGRVHYFFNLGDGLVLLRDNGKQPLNDNKWHTVTITRPSIRHHTLAVDDTFVSVTTVGHNEKLDLTGLLYIGGVAREIYQTLPKQVRSKHGFEGCLASVDLNGEVPDLLLDAVIPSAQVSQGCEGQGVKCTHSVCANRGVCVQRWSSSACDCDMTSYTGPTCSDESVSFEFGINTGGILTFIYPEDRRPEVTNDVIALGFITNKEDCVLLRIDSGTSNDYLEIEIVEGNVFMVYNVGTNDHPIGDINVKVNDDSYHILRITRNGPNSTLQLDDYSIQTHHPVGHQLGVFNSQSLIQVGGKWNPQKDRVDRYFTGIISGLVVNGLRILDLAHEKDPRISIRGDVRHISGIHDRIASELYFNRMQQTPASNFPGVMDDLVYSGAGAVCQNDDEDTCVPVFDTGSGDDLITPVYTPAPTRSPKTVHKSPVAVDSAAKPCDDEDCVAGSGAGELPEENPTTTIATKGTSPFGSTTVHIAKTSSALPGSSPVDVNLEEDVTSTVDVKNNEEVTSESTEDNSIIVVSSSSSSTTTTTTTTTSIIEHPPDSNIPQYRPTNKPAGDKKRDNISSAAAESTTLVIAIIAATMIAIVFVILIILRFRTRTVPSYKVDEGKGYHQQDPNAALLPSAPVESYPHHYNGSMNNGSKMVKKQKDVKEWYV